MSILECFDKIKYELDQRMDNHSKTLISANIELFLNYCVRFYERQFSTRADVNRSGIEKFEKLLNEDFHSDKPQSIGLPTVGYCADPLHLSPNYFGDMVEKETGKTAMEYIHLKVIDLAKKRLLDTSRSISEIAYNLGFKYPHHFTQAFKRSTGYTPNNYRTINKNRTDWEPLTAYNRSDTSRDGKKVRFKLNHVSVINIGCLRDQLQTSNTWISVKF